MTGRKYLTLAAWSAASFGLTIAFMSPSRLDAVGPNDVQGNFLNAPIPTVRGVQLSLQLPDGTAATMNRRTMIQPGNALTLQVVAVNTTNESVELPAMVTVSSSAGVSRMARSPSIQREAWRDTGTIALGPRESRTIPLFAEMALTPASNITVALSADGRVSQRLTLTVEGQMPAPQQMLQQRQQQMQPAISSAPLPAPPPVTPVNGQKVSAGKIVDLTAPVKAAPTPNIASESAPAPRVDPTPTIPREQAQTPASESTGAPGRQTVSAGTIVVLK